jgi:hypothetical protein
MLVCRSCLLSGGTPTAGTGAATTATGVESTARSLVTHASTAAGTTTREGLEGLGAHSALLDGEIDAIHMVRVGIDGGLEGGQGLEVNEGTVLEAS